MRNPIFLCLALAACSEEPRTEIEADPLADSVMATSLLFVDPATLPDMPAYPSNTSGRLRVVSAGEHDLTNDVAANAGVCRTPSMLILQASGDGSEEGQFWGMIMLLQIPLQGERATIYPVAHVDAGFPVPPASTLALELTSGTGGLAFQALQGFVQVSAFEEPTISGRFQITVREINSEDLVQMVGTFEGIEIHEIAEFDCHTAAMLEG